MGIATSTFDIHPGVEIQHWGGKVKIVNAWCGKHNLSFQETVFMPSNEEYCLHSQQAYEQAKCIIILLIISSIRSTMNDYLIKLHLYKVLMLSFCNYIVWPLSYTVLSFILNKFSFFNNFRIPLWTIHAELLLIKSWRFIGEL